MVRRTELNLDQLDKVTTDVATPKSRLKQGSAGDILHHIPVMNLRPGHLQPRRVLSPQIERRFYADEIDAKQAMGLFIQEVFAAAAARGRVYQSVLDLYPVGLENIYDDDLHALPTEYDKVLLPEEQRLRDIVQLAVTIRDGGLVQPLLVVNESTSMSITYRIVAGSRRFWAGIVLGHFFIGYEPLVKLPCRVVHPEQATPFHQAYENSTRRDLNAIQNARQLALLLYAANNMNVEEQDAEGDEIYRRAADLSLRKGHARKHTADVLTAMGGISKSRFSHLKRLLRLTDSAMQYGDRHDVPANVLERLASLPEDEQDTIITDAIRNHWTLKSLTDEIEHYHHQKNGTAATTEPDPDEAVTKLTRSFVTRVRRAHSLDTYRVAAELREQEGTVGAARIRIDEMRHLLDGIESHLVTMAEVPDSK